jgi:periplasmic protein TonB
MRTISKYLAFAICAVGLLSCASSRQKLNTEPGLDSSAEGAPVQLNKVTPDYPPEAFEKGITGTIWIKILVDTLGIVSEPTILRDRGDSIEIFEKSAIEAALKTKWKPATENGRPIAVWVTYKVDFNIK